MKTAIAVGLQELLRASPPLSVRCIPFEKETPHRLQRPYDAGTHPIGTTPAP